MDEKRDWQSLEGKIRRGKSLDVAAEEAGIPLDEAKAYLEARRASAPFDDDTLRISAAEALHYGLSTLIALTEEKSRKCGWSEGSGGGAQSSQKDAVVDLPAAQALLKFAMDAKKLLGAEKRAQERGALRDLFDRDADSGPWALKS